MSTWLRPVAAAIVIAAAAVSGCAKGAEPAARPIPALLGTAAAATTSRADLERTIAAMRRRLAEGDDPDAAIQLAEALLRQTRVTGNAGLANEAESALRRVVARDPEDYGACRMLAAVYVSQHRFADGRAEASRCRLMRRDDAWLLGVMGDAELELGEYDDAFEAFDVMMALRPNASSYARASYARELQGDMTRALELMRMALSATAPGDPEAVAWHLAQIGHLQLALGQVREAERSFAHADHVFPGHPMAAEGRARVLIARQDLGGALALLEPQVAAMPTPDGLALIGDVQAALGSAVDADRSYRLAEAAWMSDAPEPARLARFLATRGRRLRDALDLARREAAVRRDIFTDDALAWALFRAGDIGGAAAAIGRALRTGSKDRTIRYHAAAIAHARGDLASARRYLRDALDGGPGIDLGVAAEARALRATLAQTEDQAP